VLGFTNKQSHRCDEIQHGGGSSYKKLIVYT
jgi:hypothetical protein